MNPLHACMDGHRGGEDVGLFEKVGDIVYINPSTNAYCEMVSVTYHPTSLRVSTCVRYLSFLCWVVVMGLQSQQRVNSMNYRL
jgi:hypothetical protein